MSGQRLNLVHTVAEDRGPESGASILARRGQAVSGFATFYISANSLLKVPPGRLDLAELWGGASGDGNQQQIAIFTTNLQVRPEVEFYIDLARPTRSYLTLDGRYKDVFTFGFFGRRYS